MRPVRLVIITGLSGAGKSEAVKCFEDLGYFCVDNLPPALIGKFTELCLRTEAYSRLALVVDIRGGSFFDEAAEALQDLEKAGFPYEILYLEADENVIVRRFKESRRRHPLSASGSILEGINAEKKRLEELRGLASRIINTTNLSARDLRRRITEEYGQVTEGDRLLVHLISFGYKHGLPVDADIVLDARFLPNPHYVESLHDLDGNSQEVVDYVLKWPSTTKFIDRVQDLLAFVIPQCRNEGRSSLVVAIGCTGGQHRSVVIANVLGNFVRRHDYRVLVEHRDVSLARQEKESG
jgi:RNase adapter protein RapZ